MNSVVLVWQAIAVAGGLAAALYLVVDIVLQRKRLGSFTKAMDTTWITRRETSMCGSAAVLGWAFAVTTDTGHVADWESGLTFSLSGAMLFSALYWIITKGGRSFVLMALLLLALPVATGFMVA